MADTRSVRPLGLIQKLGIIVSGHRFDISVVVLTLVAPGTYPILLGDLGYAQPTSNRIGIIIVSAFGEAEAKFACPLRKRRRQPRA